MTRLFATLFIALTSFLPINAQDALGKKICDLPNYFNKQDIAKAEAIVATVDRDSLALQPDSIRYLFHYYAAAVDEIKGVATKAKVEHLRLAKLYLETLPGLGIGIHSYPEVCYALGEAYNEIGKEDDALMAWEDGAVKCFTLYGGFDREQLGNFLSILHGIKQVYERRGDKAYVDGLSKTICAIDTINVHKVADLINKAISYTMKQQPNEALRLLDEAEQLLPQINDPDSPLFYVPIYGVKSTAWALCGNYQKAKEHLKLLRSYHERYSKEGWFPSYINDIYACANHLTMRDDYTSALSLVDFAIQEAAGQGITPNEVQVQTKKDIIFLYKFYQKYDSLQSQFLSETDTCKRVDKGFELINVCARRGKYEQALTIATEIYNLTKSAPSLANQSIKALKQIVDYALISEKYEMARPYIIKYKEFIAKQYGRNSQEYAELLNQQGVVWMKSYPDESLRYLDQSYDIFSHLYGKESKEVITVLHNKGRALQLKREFKAAYQLLSKAKELQLKHHKEVYPRTQKYLSEVEYELSISL